MLVCKDALNPSIVAVDWDLELSSLGRTPFKRTSLALPASLQSVAAASRLPELLVFTRPSSCVRIAEDGRLASHGAIERNAAADGLGVRSRLAVVIRGAAAELWVRFALRVASKPSFQAPI